jgi:murein DD-endopeptidase MepM/ murein hydrolase activator NlpD
MITGPVVSSTAHEAAKGLRAAPSRRRVLAATVMSLSLATFARAAPITIDTAYRSLTPGELVVVTIKIDGAPSSVRVNAFQRVIPSFKTDDGWWRALIGIDLDQRPGRYRVEVEAEVGATVLRQSRALVVAPRKFPTRTLRVNPAFVNPSPPELARIREDQQFLAEVYARPAPARLWSGSFVRPVPGDANSSFGTRSVFNGEPRSPHGGTDFLSPGGTPIKSPSGGRVVCARDLYFTGNTVIIDHGLGMFSMLAHLSRLDVKEGDTVRVGQIVGLVGATGRVTGPHLHWALSVSGARVDPLSALALLGN